MGNYKEDLLGALRRHSLEAVCLGGGYYLRLGGAFLAKAAFTHSGGYADGLRLTVINRSSGPVDSVTIHFWELPKAVENGSHSHEDDAFLRVQRPVPDMDALTEKALEYLGLFQEPDNSQAASM
ncbi:hypothetical protein [uncultured Oscillibacter sp.]|uniref:hypothetical protein n=1 Tax=uncultured Oscillibacter sp. TaxID=876091 RepID=UPI002603F3C8|nr:hypothetical protein [uncultured Oscillibacter sp.]